MEDSSVGDVVESSLEMHSQDGIGKDGYFEGLNRGNQRFALEHPFPSFLNFLKGKGVKSHPGDPINLLQFIGIPCGFRSCLNISLLGDLFFHLFKLKIDNPHPYY
jgi:hypothetical protein